MKIYYHFFYLKRNFESKNQQITAPKNKADKKMVLKGIAYFANFFLFHLLQYHSYSQASLMMTHLSQTHMVLFFPTEN